MATLRWCKDHNVTLCDAHRSFSGCGPRCDPTVINAMEDSVAAHCTACRSERLSSHVTSITPHYSWDSLTSQPGDPPSDRPWGFPAWARGRIAGPGVVTGLTFESDGDHVTGRVTLLSPSIIHDRQDGRWRGHQHDYVALDESSEWPAGCTPVNASRDYGGGPVVLYGGARGGGKSSVFLNLNGRVQEAIDARLLRDANLSVRRVAIGDTASQALRFAASSPSDRLPLNPWDATFTVEPPPPSGVGFFVREAL